MRKILLFFGMLLLSVFGFTQTSVIITGETNPRVSVVYTYRINQFIGVSGTNATWKITNGKFWDGSTTLVQDVDRTSVEVAWTNSGQVGTLSYSYQNGNTKYAGFTSVNIKNSDGGVYEGVHDWKLDNYGVSEMSPGDSQMFSYHVPYVNLAVHWKYDPNCFEYVPNNAHDHRSITLKAKGKMEKQNTRIEVEVLGVVKSVDMAIKPIDLFINNPDKFLCANQTTVFTLQNIQYLSGSSLINWQSTSNMTLVSGQGTSTATYRGSGRGYKKVDATVTYNGVNYLVENSEVWAGRPGLGGTQFISQVTAPLEEPLTYHAEKGASSYIWTCSGNSFNRSFTTNGSAINIRFHQVGIYTIICRAINVCGEFTTTYEVTVGGMTGPGGPEEMILKSSTTSVPSPVSIKVYTFNTGTLVYSEKNVIDFNIQNTTLKEGIYVVVTTDQNGETKSEKVVKTRK